MTRKTIVFDFGKVLFRVSAGEFYRERFARQGRSEEEFRFFMETVFNDPERSRTNSGNLRPVIEKNAKLYPEWAEELRAMGPDGEFIKFIRNVIPGMQETIAELARQGHRIVGLTNWHGDTYDLMSPAFPELLSHFDMVVVSGKIGMRKPEPEIFRHAQEAFGNPDPATVYYFDDKQRNTDAARDTVGWQGFVFEGAETVRRALGLSAAAKPLALEPRPF